MRADKTIACWGDRDSDGSTRLPDVVYGRDGRDVIGGGNGADTTYGGGDFDTFHSADLADWIVDDADGYELLLSPPALPEHIAPVVSDDVAYVAVGETVDIAVLGNDYDSNENLVATLLFVTRAPTAMWLLAMWPATATAPTRSPMSLWFRYRLRRRPRRCDR